MNGSRVRLDRFVPGDVIDTIYIRDEQHDTRFGLVVAVEDKKERDVSMFSSLRVKIVPWITVTYLDGTELAYLRAPCDSLYFGWRVL